MQPICSLLLVLAWLAGSGRRATRTVPRRRRARAGRSRRRRRRQARGGRRRHRRDPRSEVAGVPRRASRRQRLRAQEGQGRRGRHRRRQDHQGRPGCHRDHDGLRRQGARHGAAGRPHRGRGRPRGCASPSSRSSTPTRRACSSPSPTRTCAAARPNRPPGGGRRGAGGRGRARKEKDPRVRHALEEALAPDPPAPTATRPRACRRQRSADCTRANALPALRALARRQPAPRRPSATPRAAAMRQHRALDAAGAGAWRPCSRAPRWPPS